MRKMWLVVDNSHAKPSVPMLVLPESGCDARLSELLGDPLFSQLDVVIGRAWNVPSLRVVVEEYLDEASRS